MTSTAESENNAFAQLEAYPWATDAEFQSGLTAILGPDPSSLEADRLQDLTLHARCFYFSRKFDTNVDFESYRRWRESQAPSELGSINPSLDSADSQAAVSMDNRVADASNESKPLSFAEVMELVQNGQPIPGVKDIPDTVLEGEGTEPSKAERSKPWETADKKGSGLFQTSGS